MLEFEVLIMSRDEGLVDYWGLASEEELPSVLGLC